MGRRGDGFPRDRGIVVRHHGPPSVARGIAPCCRAGRRGTDRPGDRAVMRRRLLAMASVPLAAALAAGLLVSRNAVRAAHEDLLLAEAGTAVALLRGATDRTSVDRLLGPRVRMSSTVDETLDDAVLVGPRTAHAAVLDAEG